MKEAASSPRKDEKGDGYGYNEGVCHFRQGSDSLDKQPGRLGNFSPIGIPADPAAQATAQDRSTGILHRGTVHHDYHARWPVYRHGLGPPILLCPG